MKNKFTKPKSELYYSKSVNNKLVNQVTNLERKCCENEQDSRREFIEIFGIPQSIEQIHLEKTKLGVFQKVHAPVDPQNIEAYNRLKSDDGGQSNNVTVQFSKPNDMIPVRTIESYLKLLT